MTLRNTLVALFVLSGLNLVGLAADGQTPPAKPGRFEKDIRKFEEKDRTAPPPRNAVVCIGSSSMRGWHGALKKDLAPLTVIPRGFGGSKMSDALLYVDRIVTNYQPRAVLLYEGDNDTAGKIPPETIRDRFLEFTKRVHAKVPKARIYFLAIKPSIARWKLWPKMVEANKLIAAECEKSELLTYLDIATPMLGEDGKPKPDIFAKDKLHMVRKGYELWRDAVRPVLVKAEEPFEKDVTPVAPADGAKAE